MIEERYQTFTVLIAKIARSIRKIKTEEMKHFHLKGPHVTCLHVLYNAPEGLTAKDLCDLCDEDKASVSRTVEFLENGGYVVCDSMAKKRYKAAFTLTEKGKEVGKFIAEKIDAVLASASVGVSEEHREILYRSLAIIGENLQQICDNYGDSSNGSTNHC